MMYGLLQLTLPHIRFLVIQATLREPQHCRSSCSPNSRSPHTLTYPVRRRAKITDPVPVDPGAEKSEFKYYTPGCLRRPSANAKAEESHSKYPLTRLVYRCVDQKVRQSRNYHPYHSGPTTKGALRPSQKLTILPCLTSFTLDLLGSATSPPSK